MSIWKKTLLYLGLGPDDEYADAAAVPYPEAEVAQGQPYADPQAGGQLSAVPPAGAAAGGASGGGASAGPGAGAGPGGGGG